jgi:hypothetical protein
MSAGLGSHAGAGLQVERVPRHHQEPHPRQDLHLPHPGGDARRLRPGGHLEAEDADPRAAQAPLPGRAHRGLSQQHHHTDQVQEELLQRAERRGHILHHHRRRGRQQEREWPRDAQLEGRPGLQHLAALSGESSLLFLSCFLVLRCTCCCCCCFLRSFITIRLWRDTGQRTDLLSSRPFHFAVGVTFASPRSPVMLAFGTRHGIITS